MKKSKKKRAKLLKRSTRGHARATRSKGKKLKNNPQTRNPPKRGAKNTGTIGNLKVKSKKHEAKAKVKEVDPSVLIIVKPRIKKEEPPENNAPAQPSTSTSSRPSSPKMPKFKNWKQEEKWHKKQRAIALRKEMRRYTSLFGPLSPNVIVYHIYPFLPHITLGKSMKKYSALYGNFNRDSTRHPFLLYQHVSVDYCKESKQKLQEFHLHMNQLKTLNVNSARDLKLKKDGQVVFRYPNLEGINLSVRSYPYQPVPVPAYYLPNVKRISLHHVDPPIFLDKLNCLEEISVVRNYLPTSDERMKKFFVFLDENAPKLSKMTVNIQRERERDWFTTETLKIPQTLNNLSMYFMMVARSDDIPNTLEYFKYINAQPNKITRTNSNVIPKDFSLVHVKCLKSLVLQNVKFQSENTTANMLGGVCHSVETIDLWCTPITNVITTKARFEKLKTFTSEKCDLQDNFFEMNEFPAIESLKLIQEQSLTGQSWKGIPETSQSVKSIHISSCDLINDSLFQEHEFPNLSDLNIDLSYGCRNVQFTGCGWKPMKSLKEVKGRSDFPAFSTFQPECIMNPPFKIEQTDEIKHVVEDTSKMKKLTVQTDLTTFDYASRYVSILQKAAVSIEEVYCKSHQMLLFFVLDLNLLKKVTFEGIDFAKLFFKMNEYGKKLLELDRVKNSKFFHFDLPNVTILCMKNCTGYQAPHFNCEKIHRLSLINPKAKYSRTRKKRKNDDEEKRNKEHHRNRVSFTKKFSGIEELKISTPDHHFWGSISWKSWLNVKVLELSVKKLDDTFFKKYDFGCLEKLVLVFFEGVGNEWKMERGSLKEIRFTSCLIEDAFFQERAKLSALEVLYIKKCHKLEGNKWGEMEILKSFNVVNCKLLEFSPSDIPFNKKECKFVKKGK